jgi:TonB family protein
MFWIAALIATETPSLTRDPQPIGNAGDWIGTEDYPPAAMHAQIAGVVGYELGIDAFGAVERCRVTSSSGSGLLDGATCGLLTARARFSPASDAAGHLVAGLFKGRARWQLPDGPRSPNLQPYSFVGRFELSEKGTVENCEVLVAEGTAAHGRSACLEYTGQTRFFPFRDERGKLVRKTVVVRQELEIREH